MVSVRLSFIFLFYFSFPYFKAIFNKTIIALALVGYEMIKTNPALRASALATYHLISNACWWNNC